MRKGVITNLLPIQLKNDKLWNSFFETLEEVYFNLEDEQISKLKNKYNLDFLNLENLTDLILKQGSIISSYAGYTSTVEFFRRRANSVIVEITYRHSYKAYEYLLKSYYMKGRITSLRNTSKGYVGLYNLEGIEFIEIVADREKDLIEYYIGLTPVPFPPPQTGNPPLYADTFLDSFDLFPVTADVQEFTDYSNILMIEISFIVIESVDVFSSVETMKSLYEQVQHYKKMRHLIRFQANIDIPLNSLTTREKVYTDYTQTLLSSTKSIHFGDLSTAKKIQIGKGRYLNLTDGSSGVQIPIFTDLIKNKFLAFVKTIDRLLIESIKSESSYFLDNSSNKVLQFSEVAILDENDIVLVYAYFPDVIFYEKMFSSIKFDFYF